MNRTLILSFAGLAGLAVAARAGELQRLEAMAADPAVAETHFTGGPAYQARAIPAPAGASAAKKAPAEAAKKPALRSQVLEPKELASTGEKKKGNAFSRGVKDLLKTVGAWAGFGAFIGLLIGLFGPQAILPATLSGALIGGGIGLIFGIAGMLQEWGS